MSYGFDRLRVVVAASVAGSILVPAVAVEARATTGLEPISIAHTGYATQLGAHPTSNKFTSVVASTGMTNSAIGPFSGATGYAAHAAENTIVKRTGSGFTLSCSTANNPSACPLRGAYQGAFVNVGGHVFKNPTGQVHLSTPSSGPNETLISGSSTLSGLKTTVRYDFISKRITRVLITMKNVGRKTVKKNIQVGTEVSTQSNTVVSSSNAGTNAALDPDDSWIVTTETTGAPHPSVLIGRGNAAIATIVGDPTSTGLQIDGYRLKIKRHKTAELLYFLVQDDRTTGTASLDAISSQFNDGSSLATNGLLAGLSPTDLARVKNWTGLT